MKKFLSIILACAMIMSLFTVVPASAAVSTGTYWVDDFEKDANPAFMANAGKRVEGGYNGSAYSRLVTVKKVTAGTTDVPYNNSDLALSEVHEATIQPGETVKVTFKYKLTHALSDGARLGLIASYYKDNGSGGVTSTGCYYTYNHTIPQPANTQDWQTFTGELSWPLDARTNAAGKCTGLFFIRWGRASDGAGNSLATALEEDVTVGYYIDDLIIERKGDQSEAVVEAFDGSRDMVNKTYGTNTKVDDPFGVAGNTVYKVSGSNSNKQYTYNFIDFDDMVINDGDTVDVSCKVYIESSNPTANSYSKSYANYCALYLGKVAPVASGYTNLKGWIGTALSTNYEKTSQLNIPLNGDDWHTINLSYTHTGDAVPFTSVRMNVSTQTAGIIDNVYLDDWTVTVNRATCKTPSIAGLTAKVDAQGNAKATYTFTKGTGDATGENASIAKFYNAQGAIIKTSDKTTDSMDIPVEYVGQTVTLKMVPVSSNGYIGEEVSCTVVVTDEDIPSEPVILKNVPVLTTSAPTKIALNTTNENAVISDTKASISADVASIFGGGSITVPVDVETAGTYSIKYENVTASAQIRASVLVDGVEQIPYKRLAFLPGNDGSYSGKYKTNEKVGFLDLKEGRNFITIAVDPAYGGAAIISYSITLELANEVDVVELSLKNNDGPRPIYSTRNGLETSAEVTLKKYGSVSPVYMLVCAGYNTNNKLTSVNTMTIDCAQMSDKETKTYTADITLDGSEYVVKAMIMEKSNLRPLTDAEAISTMSLIDDSILDNEVNYQLATEMLNNDGEYYKELGVETADYKIDAIFYDGHNDTKVFAYVGYPKNASADNKVPAMVLVHGGLGSAYKWWVEKWNKLGFAAIAMCMYGRDPENVTNANTGYVKHPYAGQHPYQLGTSFLANATEAGMYQNIVAVVNAHNILRNSGVVDTDNVGITGISWGGVTTTTAIGVDHRFKFAAPVYGCGFLDQSKTYFRDAYTGGSVHWDPANFAARTDMPVLYVNGDEDVNFSIDATSWTCEVTKNGRMSIIHSYPHDETWGSSVDQVYAFAQAMVEDKDPFITVKNDKVANGKFTATLDIPAGTTVASAEMYYLTVDEFKFYNGTTTPVPDWQLATSYTLNGSSFEMAVPSDATYLYVTFIDQDGYKISSKFIKVN